ncbi:MAG: cytochrome b/b6 domain-containing protein [Pseudomonadota bacterium]|nr:cytochrome b/b6 domain-containing protein [Pseudomonadota bacterium]
MVSIETIAVRVWDLPTRLFHWVLAVCVLASLTSAWIGGNAMVWHLRSGYVVFTLLAFRLLWGFFGGHWSRFARFVYAPSASLRYLRGQNRPDEHHHVGHNPLGAFSVFGLLAILAAQVASGLFADDEIATTGPYTKFVSAATSSRLTHWHTTFGQWLIVALVVLHIGAVLFYLVRRKQNLVLPMLSGDKALTAAVPASIDTLGARLRALAIFAAVAAIVTWLVRLGD